MFYYRQHYDVRTHMTVYRLLAVGKGNTVEINFKE